MWGICGKIDPCGVSNAEIKRMTSGLAHRGPDEHGIHMDHKFGFGHQRLSIIDLTSGHQPMFNEEATVWITYNGEIYNFQEIRKELEKKHQFKTKSDTEVLLHLYEEKGTDCLKYLRGMFAFAIFDTRKNILFIARDKSLSIIIIMEKSLRLPLRSKLYLRSNRNLENWTLMPYTNILPSEL
jgi:asparagine synthase (glutamine-hydrolysing)